MWELMHLKYAFSTPFRIFFKTKLFIYYLCVLVVCGGFLFSFFGACASTVHLEFVETCILVFLTLHWRQLSLPASQPGVFSLTPLLKSAHYALPAKSSGCFAFLSPMSGTLSAHSSSGTPVHSSLRLDVSPQRLLWLTCRWRASLSFPHSFPGAPVRPHSLWVTAAAIIVSRGYRPGFHTSVCVSISDRTLLREPLPAKPSVWLVV